MVKKGAGTPRVIAGAPREEPITQISTTASDTSPSRDRPRLKTAPSSQRSLVDGGAYERVLKRSVDLFDHDDRYTGGDNDEERYQVCATRAVGPTTNRRHRYPSIMGKNCVS